MGVTSHLVPDIPTAAATCCQSGLKATTRMFEPWSTTHNAGVPEVFVNQPWALRKSPAQYPVKRTMVQALELKQV